MIAVSMALLVLACTFAGALAGFVLRNVLPQHHLDEETKDLIKLTMGLIATMTALVLGLILTSAKAQFDAEDAYVKQSAANVLALDRVLARYGDGTETIRATIRHSLELRFNAIWPTSTASAASLDSSEIEHTIEEVVDRTLALTPTTDAQRWLQSQALQMSSAMQLNRWLMLEREEGITGNPFLVALLCWLTVIFASWGLFAPRHATSFAALGLSALSVAIAIFLILELEHPYRGLIRVSSAPVEFALAHLGR